MATFACVCSTDCSLAIRCNDRDTTIKDKDAKIDDLTKQLETTKDDLKNAQRG